MEKLSVYQSLMIINANLIISKISNKKILNVKFVKMDIFKNLSMETTKVLVFPLRQFLIVKLMILTYR